MTTDKFSIVSAINDNYLKYYLQRILSYDQATELSKKSDVELRNLLLNRISYQDIYSLGLNKMKSNETSLNLPFVNVPQVNFFRSYDVGLRRLDVTV